jgi:regulator of protease activity HflC (stomatin/prohibitin superfamily)
MRRISISNKSKKGEYKMEARFVKNIIQKNKAAKADQHISAIAGLVFGICLIVATLGALIGDGRFGDAILGTWVVGWTMAGTYFLYALKVASQWEKAVLLRLGKFRGLRGPGVFWIIPLLITSQHGLTAGDGYAVSAEKIPSKDTVPVDSTQCYFGWYDAQKAALSGRLPRHRWVETARGHLGRRERIARRHDCELQHIIDERTTPWGVTVNSVEIRDIVIPQDLEDAMSRQAQAERERQARVILGESEMQIAASFAEASKAYINNPTALHLRAMNMLFEGLKEKGALVIVPSSAVDTMNLGGLSGMVSLAQNNLPKKEQS